MQEITWQVKHFNEISVNDYHDVLHLRTAVFVVEQDCPYQEVDDKDKQAYHLFARNSANEIIAVTRILPQGISYAEVSIGRVALKLEERGKGLADLLLDKSKEFIFITFGKCSIRISAQTYLLNYYQKHGFKPVGEEYIEDGIPHVEMLFSVRKFE